jgi:hypothetical protein
MPDGSPDLRPGSDIAYSKVEGRRPVKIEIDHAPLMEVVEKSCEQETCTLTYRQKELGDLQVPQITYHLVDETGQAWSAGELKVEGQKPHLTPAKLHPLYKETVSLTVPLVDENGKPLSFEPKLRDVAAIGGKTKSALCTRDACTFAFEYDERHSLPSMTFLLEGPVYRSRQVIQAEPEKVTIQNHAIKVFSSLPSVRLIQGVDYISSWKKPAGIINVIDFKGLTFRPWFQCSEDSCLSRMDLGSNQEASLNWTIPGASGRGQLQLALADSDLRPKFKEVLVNHGEEIKVTLEPGIDYTSAEGALATALEFEPSTSARTFHVSRSTCDSKGVCSFNVSYSGNEAFVTRSYKLKVDNVSSPSELIKVIPRVRAIGETIELWDTKAEWYELVLEAGKDYVTHDGSKATAITIETYDLTFRDTPHLDDTNRSQVFQCDSEGSCRAWFKNRYTSTRPYDFTYTVQTPTGKSGNHRRSVLFKRDDMQWLTGDAVKRIGTHVDQHVDRVSFSLQKGVHYQSAFPAERLKLEARGQGLLLEQGQALRADVWDIPCDENGQCDIVGKFSVPNGYLDLSLTLRNSRGESKILSVRLVREKLAFMMPNVSSIKVQENGSEEFEVTLEAGAGKGYDGEILATRLQIQSTGDRLVNGTPVPDSTFVEYPCTADGRCSFRIRAERSSSKLSYRFLDDEGHTSYVGTLDIVYPDVMALSTSVQVPAEVSTVKFSVPATIRDYSIKLQLELPEGMSATVKRPNIYDDFEVSLTLPKPMQVDEELKLPFTVLQEGKASNRALVTLKAIQPLIMKADLQIPATKEADGTWTVTLRYQDHFQPLPQPATIIARYFNTYRMHIELESNSNILPGAMNCNHKDACTLSFVKVEGAALHQIKADLKAVDSNVYPRNFVKERSFVVTFPQELN